MGYKSRKPPIKITVTKNEYNLLVDILNLNSSSEIEDIKTNAIKLKNKFLQYSVPRLEDDKILIDIRFFPNEASEVIYQLISLQNNSKVEIDYYSVLLKVRDSLKKSNKDIE